MTLGVVKNRILLFDAHLPSVIPKMEKCIACRARTGTEIKQGGGPSQARPTRWNTG